ncbi:hypothetical protein, partial [Burkholderia sp. BCC0397]|uniref:hypothetical protein n=1 Tax=Burkholderia sp. BCC0397 TaxID=486876 RepID=UPI001ABA5945
MPPPLGQPLFGQEVGALLHHLCKPSAGPDLSVILWAGHIMRGKSHGYVDEEEEANRSASGSGPR